MASVASLFVMLTDGSGLNQQIQWLLLTNQRLTSPFATVVHTVIGSWASFLLEVCGSVVGADLQHRVSRVENRWFLS